MNALIKDKLDLAHAIFEDIESELTRDREDLELLAIINVFRDSCREIESRKESEHDNLSQFDRTDAIGPAARIRILEHANKQMDLMHETLGIEDCQGKLMG